MVKIFPARIFYRLTSDTGRLWTKEETEHESRLSKILAAGENGVIPGMVETLSFQVKIGLKEGKDLTLRII